MKAFGRNNFLFCYALKSNSNPEICRVFSRKGFGADVVSGGELYAALRSGFKSRKIVFSGVGKKEDEIDYALKSGILMINVESFEEMKAVEKIARRTKRKAPVSVRINPNVEPHTHKFVSTGTIGSKFGVGVKDAYALYKYAFNSAYLAPIGIHFHLGSQLRSAGVYEAALKVISNIIFKLNAVNIHLNYIDIGGGWGVDERGCMMNLKPLAGVVKKYMQKFRTAKFILEPGRSLTAGAGILVSRVLYRKNNGFKWFIICDAGMNDLVRPALYQAKYEICFPAAKNRAPKIKADIVGPVCESADFLVRGARIALPEQGDIFYLASAGAYGFSMSSRYNLRPRPAEAMIMKNGRVKLVRKRETLSDLL